MSLVAVLALLGLLSATFTRQTASSAASFPLFLLAAAAVFWLPGRLLLRALRVPARGLEAAVLSLAIGLPAASLAFWACVFLRSPRLFWAWPAVALALAVLTRKAPARERPVLSWAHPGLVAVVGLAAAPLFVLPLYFANLARQEDGGLSFYPLADVVLHVSIANELTHTAPPQAPFLPGRALSYHYGMDIVASALTPFGLDTRDLTVRFVPLLFAAMAVVAAFVLAREWLRAEAAALVAAVLIVFGDDFSFLPGLARSSREIWTVHFFGVPTVVSLYLLNPMLPALGLLLCTLLCLKRFLDTEAGERGWLAVAAILCATLAEYKVFTAAHLLAAIAAALVLVWRTPQRKAVLTALLVLTAATAPLVLLASAANAGRIRIAVEPWPYVPAAFIHMGLADGAYGTLVKRFYLGEWSVATSLAFCAVALPAYLLLAVGARALGLPACVRALARGAAQHPFRVILAAFVVIGPPICLLFSVTPSTYPSRQYYNNAVWFFLHSKYVLWLFAVEAVRSAVATRAAATRALAFGALLALALPSAIQSFALRAAERPLLLDPALVEALAFLDSSARPGDTCAAPEDLAQAILVSTRCRSLSLAVFPYSFLSSSEQGALRAARDAFWEEWREQGWSGPRVLPFLDAAGARFMLAPRRGAPPAPPGIRTRFANHGYVVYEVANRR